MRLPFTPTFTLALPDTAQRDDIIQPGLLTVFRVLTLLWVLAEVAVLLLDMVERNISIELAPYMLLSLTDRLVLLVYLFIPGLPGRLGRWYLPLGIMLAALGPVVSDQMFTTFAPRPVRPDGRPNMSMLLLLNRERLPYIYLPLILTAWQYGLGGVAAFSVGYVSVTYFFPMGRPIHDLTVRLLVTVIQFASLGTIGYLVAYLIAQQQKQRDALHQANTQLMHYARTMEQLTASRERNRLAHELHDTLAHTQSALAVQLEGVRALWDTEPGEARVLLQKSIDNTRSGLTETRRALKALRASPLEEMGLRLALESLVGQYAARDNLAFSFAMDPQIDDLPEDAEQVIYRITQEALENVIRHADADHVAVTLHERDGGLTLTITDDGTGFPMDRVDMTDTFGLRGIQERALLVGGHATVVSGTNVGTTVTFKIKVQS
jgi:signal transduction histidine kinase